MLGNPKSVPLVLATLILCFPQMSVLPGYYDWKDNTLVDYQNWRSSEGQPDIIWPDDGRGCGFIPPESTGWHDDSCLANKRFVCKVPLSKFLITIMTLSTGQRE